MKVFDKIKIKETGEIGKVIILIGFPYRELYAEMYPGAGANFEYFTMWDEEEQRTDIRALNRYTIDEVEPL